jgi:hypothetical protein
MHSNYPLFFVILSLFVLIFITKKEGLDTNIDEEINVPIKTNDLIAKIQINFQGVKGQKLPSGPDAWINLGDITLRDRNGNQINYGNTNSVYFGNKGNWEGLPVQNLWDNDKVSMGHASREYEVLIIDLLRVQRHLYRWDNMFQLGSVQITNRSDCCEWRIGNYELALYNVKNEKTSIMLDKLAFKGKTVRYNMVYPK